MAAVDSAVYWIEYSIRHAEAANIRPLSAEASWISHFMVDLYGALAVTLFAFGYCARFAVSYLKL